MKKGLAIFCAAAAAFAVFPSFPALAQPPAPYPVTINSQVQTAPGLTAFRSEPRTFRVTFKDGSAASDVSAATVFFGWATSVYAQTYATATWSKVSGLTGVVDFTMSAADVNFTAGEYVYFTGAGSTYRQGVFTIYPSPWGSGVAAPTFVSNINMDVYTWTGGPFIRSADASNSFAQASDLVTASNALQAAIDGIVVEAGNVGAVTGDVVSIFINDAGYVPTGTLTATLGNYATIEQLATVTDATARAWAVAGSNLAATAAADNTTASNYFALVMATDAELSAAQADASNQFYLATNPSEYIRNRTATNIQIYTGGGVVTATGATGAMQRGLFTGTNSIAANAHGASQEGNVSGTATIGDLAYGASQEGYIAGTATIGDLAYGASQEGRISGTATIGSGAYSASQEGYISGTATIGSGAYGASQEGRIFGIATIGDLAHGASQEGFIAGTATIGDLAYGASQEGRIAVGASATNNGAGALQLLDLASGEHALTTSDAGGSILLGPGTNNVKYSLRAKGGVWTPLDSTNELGIVNVTSINASGLTGAIPSAVVNASGVATGSPLYGYTETDPVWAASSNLYALKTDITGLGTDETARAWAVAASNLAAAASGIAVSGSNLAATAAADNTTASNYFALVMATDAELSAAQADASNQFYLATNPSEYIRNRTATNIQIYTGGGVVTATGATGAMQRGLFTGTNSIAANAHGASQEGRIFGIATIGGDAYGASQEGYISGTATIGSTAFGASQEGYIFGTATIGSGAYGASQEGYIIGTATIGSGAYGASQEGRIVAGASATNNGAGALQLLDLASGEHALTTSDADGSILLGPGTNNVKYSLRAKGGVWTPLDSTNELGIVTGNTFAANSVAASTFLDGTNALDVGAGTWNGQAIASGASVTSVNGETGAITIDAGTSISITQTGGTINVASTVSGADANKIAVTGTVPNATIQLKAGSGIGLSQADTNITINNTLTGSDIAFFGNNVIVDYTSPYGAILVTNLNNTTGGGVGGRSNVVMVAYTSDGYTAMNMGVHRLSGASGGGVIWWSPQGVMNPGANWYQAYSQERTGANVPIHYMTDSANGQGNRKYYWGFLHSGASTSLPVNVYRTIGMWMEGNNHDWRYEWNTDSDNSFAMPAHTNGRWVVSGKTVHDRMIYANIESNSIGFLMRANTTGNAQTNQPPANTFEIGTVLKVGSTSTVSAVAGMIGFSPDLGQFVKCRTNGTWEIFDP